MLFRYIVLILLSLIALACGSSDGSSSTVAIRVKSPNSGAIFAAGETIQFELETKNFLLAPPFDRRSFHDHPGDNETPEPHEHDSSQSDSHEAIATADEHSDSHEEMPHDHDSVENNSFAREGHYHVYLDAASGSDPHLTSWNYIDTYQLPADIVPGTHTLRFELRDNTHVLVGSPGSETVLFFEVK